MTLQIADRVKETTTTTGTGTLTLGGAMTGFRAFSSVCSNADTCYYALQAVDGSGNPTGAWETGLGTYTTSGNTLARTLLASSTGSLISLATGTTQVWLDLPASWLAPGTGYGYPTVPQNSQSAPYTCVLADAGKQIFHPAADTTARTFTIPANSSVAYPIGTTLTFVNQNAAGVVTIAITTDTMRLLPTGGTGSRTLAANGQATALKITSTEWQITGTNLT